MDCTVHVVKTKVLISCAFTAQLICLFVFAYAKSRYSHDVAHIFFQIHKLFRCVLKQSLECFISKGCL